MTRAAGYLRVSSAQQRDRVTIESQRRDVPAYIASQGWELIGLYEDDGRTAKAGHLDARDGFARLLADIGPRRIDVVAVVAVDRLTRSEDPVERAQVVASITRAGAQVAIVGAGVQDVGTFAGDAYLTLQGLFAAEENRRRRARVIAGHATAIGRGRKPRGSTPYGLAYDPATGRWSLDPEHAPIVAEVIARTAAGEPSQRIALDLERRGIGRPRGGRWTSERVRAIVGSDAYAGRWVADGRRGLTLSVPAVVEADELDAARAALAARYRKPAPRVRYHHLLTGLATCAMCHAGLGLAGTMDRATGTQPTAYRCLHRRSPPPGKAPCTLPLHRTAALDARVWAEVGAEIARPDVIDRVLARRDTGTADRDEPDRLRAELARIEARQAAVLDHAARGTIAPELADAQVRRLGADRQRAQVALRAAEAALAGIRAAAPADVIEEHLRLLRLGVEHAPPEERPGLLRDLVTALVVGARHISIDLAVPVPTRLPGAGSSGCSRVPVTIGTLTVLAPRPRAA